MDKKVTSIPDRTISMRKSVAPRNSFRGTSVDRCCNAEPVPVLLHEIGEAILRGYQLHGEEE